MELESLINEVEDEHRSGGFLSVVRTQNFIFQRDISEVSPGVKLGILLFGILLIPFFGFGFIVIWYILRQGPINEHTRIVKSKIYLKKHHGILQYETHNDRVKKAKLTQIDKKSFITKEDGHHGESWIPDVTYTLITSNEKIGLLFLNDVDEIARCRQLERYFESEPWDSCLCILFFLGCQSYGPWFGMSQSAINSRHFVVPL